MMETKWMNTSIKTPPPSMEVIGASHDQPGLKRVYHQEGKFFNTWHKRTRVDIWTNPPELQGRFHTHAVASRVLTRVIEQA